MMEAPFNLMRVRKAPTSSATRQNPGKDGLRKPRHLSGFRRHMSCVELLRVGFGPKVDHR
jgi:hypothetical protein